MAKCNFFFSGLASFHKELEAAGITGFNELVSYWEVKTKKMGFDWINELSTKRGMIMIDSGAFSAFNSGVHIDIQEFIAWHKQLEKECPQIKIKAGLDDIENPENNFKNQQITDAAGLQLFPTYHRQDPEANLDWILEGKYPLVGFGGLAGGGLSEADAIEEWLERAYSRICDSEGRATVQTHLFGVANIVFLQRFPAWSNDSAGALWTGSYGKMTLPAIDPVTYQPKWDVVMSRFDVSSESNSRGNSNAHFDTLKPAQKEIIVRYLESIGWDIEKIKTDHAYRKCFAVLMMIEQAKHYPEDPRYTPQPKELDFF